MIRNVEVRWLLGRLPPDHKTSNRQAFELPCRSLRHRPANPRAGAAVRFLAMKRLNNARTEMARSAVAYDFTRVINILGVTPII